MYQIPSIPSSGGQPIGALFSETIRLLRRHLSVFVKIAALQVVPQLLFAIGLQMSGILSTFNTQFTNLMTEFQKRLETTNPQANPLAGFPWGLPTDGIINVMLWVVGSIFIHFFIFRTLAMGATMVAVGDAYQTQEPSASQAILSAFGQIGPLFLWAIISAISVFGSIILLLIPCLGLFIWAGTMIFLSIRFAFVPQVIVAEDTNVFTAMGRSWELTKGSFGRVFSAWLLFFVLVSLAASILIAIIIQIVSVIAGGQMGFIMAVNQGLSTFVNLITMPIGYIGFTLLYYDQLRRFLPPSPPQETSYTRYE